MMSFIYIPSRCFWCYNEWIGSYSSKSLLLNRVFWRQQWTNGRSKHSSFICFTVIHIIYELASLSFVLQIRITRNRWSQLFDRQNKLNLKRKSPHLIEHANADIKCLKSIMLRKRSDHKLSYLDNFIEVLKNFSRNAVINF